MNLCLSENGAEISETNCDIRMSSPSVFHPSFLTSEKNSDPDLTHNSVISMHSTNIPKSLNEFSSSEGKYACELKKWHLHTAKRCYSDQSILTSSDASLSEEENTSEHSSGQYTASELFSSMSNPDISQQTESNFSSSAFHLSAVMESISSLECEKT
uniref:Uncharacterized protein n=1 Tax=Scytodes thoracica TaxID=1112478 RepID=A0A0A0V7K6_SCYTH|nr:hypothetical protein [Scytodes thoracica]